MPGDDAHPGDDVHPTAEILMAVLSDAARDGMLRESSVDLLWRIIYRGDEVASDDVATILGIALGFEGADILVREFNKRVGVWKIQAARDAEEAARSARYADVGTWLKFPWSQNHSERD